MANQKILVTGGAGYLGSVLVPSLLKEGYSVTVLDNFLFEQITLADCCGLDNFQIVKGDCRNEMLMKDLLLHHDIIIPLAALVGAPICNTDPLGARTINQEAIEMLCRLASTNQKIIMPVSNSGYGIGEKDKFCDENSPLNPISVYGVTKVNAEKSILERENSISLRLATVFGASQRMRVDLLVNDFTYRAVNDNAVVIFEGHFKRNYIHIQDVANVFIHSIKNFSKMKGQCFNVGLEDANLSKLELCELIQKYVPKFQFLEAPIGEDPDKRDYIVSNKKLYDTGFMPKFNLDYGVKELIKMYTIVTNRKYGNI